MTSPSASDEGLHLTVVQVAARLGKRYHKARDMMLQGKLGKPTINGRTMTVPLAGIMAFEAKQREEAARASKR